MSLIHPLSNSRQNAKNAQQEQKSVNQESVTRQFEQGDSVMYWNEHHKRWYHGTITELQGSRVVVIEGEHGKERKHIDHITKTLAAKSDKVPTQRSPERFPTQRPAESLRDQSSDARESSLVNIPLELANAEVKMPEVLPDAIGDNSQALPTRSSTRKTKPPDRLAYKTLGDNA